MPAPSSTPFEIGDVVAERYRIVRLLGEGGMAVVYEGEHLRLRQPVAVKVLREELRSQPDVVARFEREGRAIAKLRSRHIVRVFDVDRTAKGVPFLVMELLAGRDLQQELENRGALPVGEAVGYMVQACAAVAEAHDRGVIHRDIKPSNLLLANEDGARVIKVLDFGISKDPTDDARLTKTEAVMGTPLYMAPEQFRSAKEVDGRADVWALGATLYELLSGRPPFDGESAAVAVSIVVDPLPPLASFRAELPDGLVRAVERALEKKREERFATVSELAAALAPFAGALPASLLPSAMSRGAPSVHPEAQTVLAMDAPPPSRVAVASPSTGPEARTQVASSSTKPPAPEKKSHGAQIGAAILALTALGGIGWYVKQPAPTAPAVPVSDRTGLTPQAGTPGVVSSAVIGPAAPVVDAAPPMIALSVSAPTLALTIAPTAAPVTKRSAQKAPSATPVATTSSPPGKPPMFFPEEKR